MTVGVTAHHLAGALEAVAGIVTGIVSGAPSPGNFTRAKEFGASVPQLVPWKRFSKAEEVAPLIRLLGLQASKLRDSGAVHDGAANGSVNRRLRGTSTEGGTEGNER